MENLRYVVNKTGARIVLSTDWRRTKEARNEVKRILAHHGMEYISCTPQHGSPYSLNRATEVLSWVEDYNARCREEGRDASEMVEAFCAIDDRPLIHEVEGQGMVGHFVMTHIRRGLTRPACEAVIKCLETPQHIPEVLLNPDVKAAVRGGRIPPRVQLLDTSSRPAYAQGGAMGTANHAGVAATVARAVNSSRESSQAANGHGTENRAVSTPVKPRAVAGVYGNAFGAMAGSKPSTPTSPRTPKGGSPKGGLNSKSPGTSPSARGQPAGVVASSRYQSAQISAGYEMTTWGNRASMAPRTPNGKYAASPGSRGSPLSSTQALRDSLPLLSTQGQSYTMDGNSPRGTAKSSALAGSPGGLGGRALTPGQRSILRARTTGGSGVAPPTLAMSKTISQRGGRFATSRVR